MNKKRVILFSVLFVLAVALVLVALLVPEVHLVGKNNSQVVVYEKSVSLIQYLKDAPFLTTEAWEVYFEASGPIWMSTASIMINLLVAVGGTVMALVCLIEVVLCAANGVIIKSNLLAKKMCIAVGAIAMFEAVFSIASYVVTTSMAGGYVEFNLSIAPFVIFALGLSALVIACFTGKRQPDQYEHKYKNSVGFAMSALLSAVCAILLFYPQFADFYMPPFTSFFDVSRQATSLAAYPDIKAMVGDLPYGVAQYVIYAICAVCAFVLVYSVIGLILTLCNKKTNWLSARVKRWGMALIFVYALMYILVFCQIAVWTSSLYEPVAKLIMLQKYAFAFIFVPYLPYMFATMISFNKKPKKVKEQPVQPEEMQETQETVQEQ